MQAFSFGMFTVNGRYSCNFSGKQNKTLNVNEASESSLETVITVVETEINSYIA